MYEDGFIALIAAITARARADAAGPTSCGYREKDKWQRDAVDFLATLEAQRTELEDLARVAASVDVPHRKPYGGRFRWDMTALDPAGQDRARQWQRRKRELAGAAPEESE